MRPPHIFSVLLIALIAAATPFLTTAQEESGKPFTWRPPETIGGSVVVTVDVSPKHYLHAEDTKVRIGGGPGASMSATTSPASTRIKDALGQEHDIYSAGKHTWVFDKPTFANAVVTIEYQGCGEEPYVCYPPATLDFSLNPTPSREDKGSPAPSEVKPRPHVPAAHVSESAAFRTSLARGGLWALLAAFAAGLATAFTPCVLPLIPITLAVMGAGKQAARARASRRAAIYVAGLVVSFTALGVLASVAGRPFGSLLGNVWFQVTLAAFFALMAVSLLGLYDLSLPSWLQTRVNALGGAGDKGAFLMGLVGGLVAVPCVGPVLATLLGFAASTANILASAALFGSYALGFGTPLLVVGAGFARLPTSGPFMETVKSALGVAVLILAIYVAALASPAFGSFLSKPSEASKAIAVLLIVAGALLGVFHLDGHHPRRRVRLAKLAGAIMLSFGIVWTLKIPVGHDSSEAKLSWSKDLESSLKETVRSGKPLCLKFTADWCPACKELAAVTLSDDRVAQELRNNWILAVVDATRSSPELRTTEKRFDIVGYPTLILCAPDGKRLRRVEGFIAPEPLLKLLAEAENDIKNKPLENSDTPR